MGEAAEVSLGREPIAVIGSSCRFPGGATSPSKLWRLLKEPRDIVQEVPSTRFDAKAFYNPDPLYHGSTNAKHAYLLEDDPRAFDRDFFNISPKEAEAMDPQQRCLLEIVYEGIQSAGYSIPQLRGSTTGVFVGAMSFDYQFVAMRGLDSLPQYHATGASTAILANRVSYFYDWRGASMTLDTACSSSLVALHQAVLSLRSGQVNMAVAAGTNLILGPEPFISESMLNMLSPNGRSYMWDSSADGYTRGEGFAAVILKTVSQAIADGDHIECIIRETGVNSDGRTPGITMPSAAAQTRLIRDTYAKAGLDLSDPKDRPQYFEAHGTGTPAGDPIEARAIHDAFFPSSSCSNDAQQLWVGSIKTLIGHTEGTAGLAGVLKASLAVQHGHIPANLHFRDLNPKILPFSKRLHVPTNHTPWPALPAGTPRRVSVNSFGFGGTNAHAIIESWEGAKSLEAEAHAQAGLFVLSANSAQALSAQAASLANYVLQSSNIDLGSLSRTLFQRAEFPFRAAFSAIAAVQLADKLEAAADNLKNASKKATIPDDLPPRLLGVFTGQGAQWATMGLGLYYSSEIFKAAIDNLQMSLDTLPESDRPDWKLIDELAKPKDESRVGVATISQPICTAVQVALVDTLHAAGMEFTAVVGHSSGEIGAAYAAGYLEAKDAIRIAHYRGFHSHLARGPGGKGKMMAVGMSLEQATAFCKEIGTERLKVAASNSMTSCTLAGDSDAIDEAKQKLDGAGTFARALAVDTAYHSHHMLPCAGPYLDSLQKCGVSVKVGKRRCTWYSSVWGANGRRRSFDDQDSLESLKGQYWVDNLTNTVQFSQAVSRAVSEESYILDLALEVGPHPALKGPASEVIKTLTGVAMPYGSVLKRGDGAVESFLDGLGLLWSTFSTQRPIVTFDGIQNAFTPNSRKPTILKGLPPYPFDHNGLIWRESRASRKFRTQQGQPRHELLGFSSEFGESDQREVHWHQVFKLSELPWVRGHTIQGEVLFPATAYITMAYEAAVRLVDSQQPINLVELNDIEIVKTMGLQEDSPGLEVIFTIKVKNHTRESIIAEVACYSGDVNMAKLDGPMSGLTNHFSGSVRIVLGAPQRSALPSRTESLLPMDTLDMQEFYGYLDKVGYNYSGQFNAPLVKRHLNHAVVSMPEDVATHSTMTRPELHPAALDTSIQGLLAAFSYPEDGRLKTTYLPTAIDCIRINMAHRPEAAGRLKADSYLAFADAKALTGEVDLFDENDGTVQVQMRGVHWTALDQNIDRWLYAGEGWVRDVVYGIEPAQKANWSAEEEEFRMLLVRVAHFYLRKLKDTIKTSELMLMGKHRKHMMKWVREHLFPEIEAGKHLDVKTEWAKDTIEDIQKWSKPYLEAGNNDMLILHAVGSNLPAIARGTVPALQVMLKDDMLNRLYMEGVGFVDGNLDFEPLVRQLAHRHPRMNVIEVGAGTGGTTKAVFAGMGDRFSSYTYTDISAGFFEQAKAKFSQQANRMVFKTLNIEKDPTEQEFEEGSYDLLVASNCLHATRTLQETMTNARRLLKPGGYLMLLEITRDHLPIQLIMGTLPGWFLGIEDGRVWAPTQSLEQWDSVLKATGFSGVDSSSTPSYCSVIMSQAVDETVQVLREPLLHIDDLPTLDKVVVVGDSALATEAKELLAKIGAVEPVQHGSLEDVGVPYGAVVLCMCDLDDPVFGAMNPTRFGAMQNIFRNASVVLWVTSGAASGEEPLANVTIGLGRTLLAERSELKLQFLDVEDSASLKAETLATLLLRLTCAVTSDPEKILWTHEPHLALKDGALYIPRVLPLDSVNRRSLARTKQVKQTTGLESADTAVEVSEQDGALELLDRPISKAGMQIRVTASSLKPVVGDSHLLIGNNTESGDKVLAVWPTNSSVIAVPPVCTLHRFRSGLDDEDAGRLRRFVTRALVRSLPGTGKTWVHGASKCLSQAIARERQDVFQTTSASAHDDEQVFIHPFSSKRDLLSLQLPKDVCTFVDMSGDKTLLDVFKSLLPKSALVVELAEEQMKISLGSKALAELAKAHFAPTEGQAEEDDEDDLAEEEEDDDDDDGQEDEKNDSRPRRTKGILPINDVVNAEGMDSAAVIDWNAAKDVDTLVRPLEHSGLFQPNKTYILFGMTGDVGISVARWMADNGAEHVVLTSRNPTISEDVVEYFTQKGADLRAMKVDVTNREVLKTAMENIKTSMPPIGGIINGAMVLRDRLFVDMSWQDFAAVLGPKVIGTRNLDELFGEESDEKLDFFICLSSATSFVGILGQSAYSAANHYMASLMRRRRDRGLAGSTVVIGFLTGLGYIFRSEKSHLAAIEKSLLPRLERQAETDLHEMLAEAIVCGRPDSDQPSELITGIRTNFTEPWHEDPRLSCYLVPETEADDSADAAEGEDNVKVQTQLAAASVEEAQGVIEKCFGRALGNMLQLDPAKINPDAAVSDLGVDSLVSVRVREWFLKELGVEVPILKIMAANMSISRLCEDALAGWRKTQGGAAGVAANDTKKAPQEPAMDWTKELNKLIEAIPALVPPGMKDPNVSLETPRTQNRRVVITGCTGFLGTHMIRNLVADPNIAEVHCLCIRSRPVRVQSDKIHEYKGDLTKPFLGLFMGDFVKLSQAADLIIHVGAEVNHLKSYESMRPANVNSTQTLLAMARPRNVPVHYISSSSVTMLQKDVHELFEVPPSYIKPPTDAESLMGNAIGYAASKWMGEMLLEHAGQPAVVHRFPNIMGPDAPDEIPLVALDRYCTRLRAVPALDPTKWQGHLDIIDVSDVVPEFVEKMFAFSSKGFGVYNYCSANRYLLSDLSSMYKEKLGGNVEVWPTAEWMRRARAMGMPKGVEVTFTGHDDVFVSPVLRKGLPEGK